MYVTIKKAAKLLHVNPQTLRNWDKRGVLRPYRHPASRYRLYRLEQIEEFLRRLEISRARQARTKIDVF